MRRTIGIAAVIVAVMGLVGGVARFLWILPYPIKTGEEKGSPDGQCTASVMHCYDVSFLGYSREWYEYEVRGPEGVRDWRSDPVPFTMFGSRTSGTVIVWSEDSTKVRFLFQDVEVVMTPP
jgi:hypothetical protein